LSINKWKSSSISLKNNNNTLKKLENIINESPRQYHIMLKSFKTAFLVFKISRKLKNHIFTITKLKIHYERKIENEFFFFFFFFFFLKIFD
jgi:hypothetical protein